MHRLHFDLTSSQSTVRVSERPRGGEERTYGHIRVLERGVTGVLTRKANCPGVSGTPCTDVYLMYI